MPANIELSAMDMSLVNAMSREFTLRTYVNEVKKNYDTVLIDCMPSLGMITINALGGGGQRDYPGAGPLSPGQRYDPAHANHWQGQAADQPVPQSGRRTADPCGWAHTIWPSRRRIHLRQSYGSVLKIYRSEIPVAIKAAEISAAGRSIYAYDNGSKVAQAYAEFSKESAGGWRETTR